MKKLSLLQNSTDETMRIYYPLGLNVREALQHTALSVGAGADGTAPVAVRKGDIVRQYATKLTLPKTALLTGMSIRRRLCHGVLGPRAAAQHRHRGPRRTRLGPRPLGALGPGGWCAQRHAFGSQGYRLSTR